MTVSPQISPAERAVFARALAVSEIQMIERERVATLVLTVALDTAAPIDRGRMPLDLLEPNPDERLRDLQRVA